MRKSMRYFRITWTVFCAIACVLLIVLWVRSYWRWDVVYLPDNRMLQLAPTMFWTTEVASHRGQLTLARGLLVFGNEAWKWTIAPEINDGPVIPPPSVLGFRYKERVAKTSRRPSEYVFVVPYYFAFFLTSSLSLAPWVLYLPNRFSLRTLLIATTLVAVVLGLIVWLR